MPTTHPYSSVALQVQSHPSLHTRTQQHPKKQGALSWGQSEHLQTRKPHPCFLFSTRSAVIFKTINENEVFFVDRRIGALHYLPTNCTNEVHVVEQLTSLAKDSYYLLRCCVCTEERNLHHCLINSTQENIDVDKKFCGVLSHPNDSLFPAAANHMQCQ